MQAELWKKVDELYHAALAEAPEKRAEFLARACPDAQVRAEVQSLLEQAGGSFLDTSPLPSVVRPGVKLGKFEILELIGRGGMGVVYRARDLRLGRDVALKVLPESFAHDPERTARLRHEAQALAALNHPNIAAIHDLADSDGRSLLVLEFVPGETLDQRLSRGPLPLREALSICRQIADALDAAHRHGVIHRDLKPSNIKVAPDGRVRLLDFGLAKTCRTGSDSDHERASSVTVPGEILGTAAYMSPEQARGLTLDARTDMWSFGCVLYEALMARPLFSGPTPSDILAAILRDDRRLDDLPKGTPARLRRLLNNCLCSDREQRLADAALAAAELDGCLAGHLPDSLPRARSAVRSSIGRALSWRRIAAAAALVTALAVAYDLLRHRSAAPRGSGWEQFQHARMLRLTTSGGAFDGAISPDGRYVAYVLGSALHVIIMNGRKDVEISPPTDVTRSNLVFSPDSRRIFYTEAERHDTPSFATGTGVLYSMPVLGGQPGRIRLGVDGRIAFAPRGDEFAFRRADDERGEDSLIIARLDGSAEQRIAVAKFPKYLADPAWSPAGNVIAYASTSGAFFQWHLITQAPDAGASLHVLTPSPMSGSITAAWLANGSGLALVAEDRARFRSQIWTIDYPSGVLRQITNDLDSYHGISASADSRTLVTSRTEVMSSLWVMQAVRPGRFGMARAITSVNSTWDGMDSLDWTPDDRILYSSLVSGSGDLWLIDAEGRNRRQITNMKARNHFGTASPDGRFILFGSMQGGGQNLWRVPTAGGEPRQISVGDSDMECRYSPDGRWIYYISISSGKRLLMRMPAEGGPAVRLSETPTYPWHFDVSPDGTRIAFLVFDPVKHGYRFAVIPSSGGSPVAFVDAPGPEDVRWTHDGTALMYVAAVDGSVNVWARPVDRGPAWKVTNFGEGSIFRFATSPDGRWLALARGQRLSDVVAIQRTE